jgi:hypothetical protein
MRRSIPTLVCLGLLSSTASGASIQLIENFPSSYLPGELVEFDVRLPAMSNLGAYNLDIVLESSTGTAGIDFYLDDAATAPAPQNYVFPPAVFFFDSVNIESSTRHRITLTDFDLTGVDLVSGTNDRVAHVVFRTSPSFSYPLSLFVDSDSLILDTIDLTPTPIEGFEALQKQIADAGAIVLDAVPEPSSVSLFVLGLVALSGVPYSRRAAR